MRRLGTMRVTLGTSVVEEFADRLGAKVDADARIMVTPAPDGYVTSHSAPGRRGREVLASIFQAGAWGRPARPQLPGDDDRVRALIGRVSR